MKPLRLHVNVDHVATLRQARREAFPDPVAWARACEAAGADGITCHLRKDRRHVQDHDVLRLRDEIQTVLNLEVSLDPEMMANAIDVRAHAYCLVPEKRTEVTTEGGLDCRAEHARLREAVSALAATGGLVSLFVDPDPKQLDVAAEVGAPFIELHTGAYANAVGAQREVERQRLIAAAKHAREIGLRVNAGHGLDHDNVTGILELDGLEELNIGFALVARAVFVGVEEAVRSMLERMGRARS